MAVSGRTGGEHVAAVEPPRRVEPELGCDGGDYVDQFDGLGLHRADSLARLLVQQRHVGDPRRVGLADPAGSLARHERDSVVGGHDHDGPIEVADRFQPVEVLTQ